MEKRFSEGFFTACAMAGIILIVFTVSELVNAPTPDCKYQMALVAFGAALFGWVMA